jgi:hypothetical protein
MTDANSFADGGIVNPERASIIFGVPAAAARAYIQWCKNPGLNPEEATTKDIFMSGYNIGAETEYESVIDQVNEKLRRADAAADAAISENAKQAVIEELEKVQDYCNEQFEWRTGQYISLRLRDLDRKNAGTKDSRTE